MCTTEHFEARAVDIDDVTTLTLVICQRLPLRTVLKEALMVTGRVLGVSEDSVTPGSPSRNISRGARRFLTGAERVAAHRREFCPSFRLRR
jgi:hypothetical protein